jgi:hypothetical protein
MSFLTLASRTASLLWLEPGRIRAGAHSRPSEGLPDEDRLAQALTALPQGPTSWILDDLWAPSVLLRDIAEVPSAQEAQEAFFRWRFNQALALDTPHIVQPLQVDEGLWLLAGLPQERRDTWLALALRLGRPIHKLVPRWLWLYNRLAPTRELPGILLSLGSSGDGRFTGTLAAWGRTLSLVRQWSEPMDLEAWHAERLLPTLAFLQREGRTPQELWVWGVPRWPESSLTAQVIQPEIPDQESL